MTTTMEILAAAVDFGAASARKGGRNPQYPWVPIIRTGTVGDYGQQTSQIKGLAYATRDEAVARAQATIDCQRSTLARQLADPRYRALREQHGLPRELA